jgi:hypothetical protein
VHYTIFGSNTLFRSTSKLGGGVGILGSILQTPYCTSEEESNFKDKIFIHNNNKSFIALKWFNK